jgi:phosphatidylserine/phosphatidylglycerophosphate/cardiolipin synthase-like enzyme
MGYEQQATSNERQEEGISLILHNDNILHPKVILFDQNAVMIGSVNIDNRSLRLNSKSSVLPMLRLSSAR